MVKMILLFMLGLSFTRCALGDHSLRLAVEGINGQIQYLASDRFKRQSGDSSGAQCMQGCMISLQQGIKALGAGDFQSDVSQGVVSTEFFADKGKFSKFCKTFQKMNQCMKDCERTSGSSPAILSLISASFKPLEFLCVDHYDEFLEYQPCYEKTKETAKKLCGNECGDIEFVRSKAQQMQGAMTTGNIEEVKTRIAELCQFIDCGIKCQDCVLTQECQDPRPAKLMQDFIALTFKNMDDALSRLGQITGQGGVGGIFPQECRRLGNEVPKCTEKKYTDLQDVDIRGGMRTYALADASTLTGNNLCFVFLFCFALILALDRD